MSDEGAVPLEPSGTYYNPAFEGHGALAGMLRRQEGRRRYAAEEGREQGTVLVRDTVGVLIDRGSSNTVANTVVREKSHGTVVNIRCRSTATCPTTRRSRWQRRAATWTSATCYLMQAQR